MKFEIIGEIANVETIAQGNGIHNLPLLRKQHGLGNWRKKKHCTVEAAGWQYGNG